MCENLVHVASSIGELQHTRYLKPEFLDTFKRLVFPDWATYTVSELFIITVQGHLYTKYLFVCLASV